MPSKKPKKPIPFEFVLEELYPVKPWTRPMFGCTAVYVEEKIVFVLRDKASGPKKDNGVWLATTPEHHVSLKKEFPNMKSISVFGPGPTGWQVLRSSSPDFESSVYRACEMVLKRDLRIGKVPGAKAKPKAKKKV